MAQVNDSLCLLVQVESKTALDNLDEILDVEGIDGVFIGPADLSASLGYPDNAGHPEVQRIIETSIRRIRAAGKAAGFLAVAPDMAQQCLAWGANFVAVGVDTMLYSDALDQRLAMFKSGTNGPRINGSYCYQRPMGIGCGPVLISGYSLPDRLRLAGWPRAPGHDQCPVPACAKQF